jgi:hypothetical protein
MRKRIYRRLGELGVLGSVPIVPGVIYDSSTSTFYDQLGNVLDASVAYNRYLAGEPLVDYGTGNPLPSFPAVSGVTLPTVLVYDPSSQTYYSQMGDVIPDAMAQSLFSAGMPLYQYGTGAAITKFPGYSTPTQPQVPTPTAAAAPTPKAAAALTPTGPVSTGLAPPALAPQPQPAPGILQQAQAWLSKGNNAALALGGGSALLLVLAFVGGKRRR